MALANLFTKARRALHLGLFVLLSTAASISFAGECYPNNSSELVKVKRVTDGDTLVLVDGRKVRLIGINTPELGHGKRLSEPYSQRAKQLLSSLVAKDQSKIRLAFEHDKKDRHGRVLAHALNSDQQNLGAEMLKSGLGAFIAVGKNTKQARCFKKLETQARAQKLGIWSSNNKTITPANSINSSSTGFHIVTGEIKNIKEMKNLIKIQLGNIDIIIFNKFKHEFKHLDILGQAGKTIEVRGWVTKYRGKPQIKISSPYAIALEK